MHAGQYHRLRLLFSLAAVLLLFSGCPGDECNLPDCRTILNGGPPIVVTESVSGGQGTQITPDIVDTASVTANSAAVSFTILRIGGCHDLIGHGHVWSSNVATPTLGRGFSADYGDNANFNDRVITIMEDLAPGTTYYVRSFIAIENRTCDMERIIFYNDVATEFTTTE